MIKSKFQVINKENYPKDATTQQLFPYKDYVFERIMHKHQKWIEPLINFILGALIIACTMFYAWRILLAGGGLN
jgi:hypothetical protein